MDRLLPQIKKYLSNTKFTEAEDIVCDTIQIKEITNEAKEEMEKYINVNLLCFNSCQMKTLNNLPRLPLLEEIQLSDNNLTGMEISKLLIYPHLMTLKICNNLIKDIEDLKPLVKLTELTYLDLSECPVTKCDNYRKKVFEMIPHLSYLDLLDKNGNNYSDIEEDDNEEEGEEEEDEDGDFIVKDEDKADNNDNGEDADNREDAENEEEENEEAEEEGDKEEPEDKERPIKKPKS